MTDRRNKSAKQIGEIQGDTAAAKTGTVADTCRYITAVGPMLPSTAHSQPWVLPSSHGPRDFRTLPRPESLAERPNRVPLPGDRPIPKGSGSSIGRSPGTIQPVSPPVSPRCVTLLNSEWQGSVVRMSLRGKPQGSVAGIPIATSPKLPPIPASTSDHIPGPWPVIE